MLTRPWPGSATTRRWTIPEWESTTVHHLSDTHAGLRPWSTKQLDTLRADVDEGLVPPVDAMVATGDLTDHALPAEDAYILPWLDDVAMGAPSLVIPGNHDLYNTRTTAAQWSAVYGRPANSFIDVAGYRFIGFSPTSWAEGTDWFISASTWDWLDAAIAAAPGPVVLVSHYPPWELQGITQGTSIQPAAELGDLVDAHPAVEGMLVGHMHWPTNDVRACSFATLGGRQLPVLMGASQVIAPALTRDQSARHEPVSTYVTMLPGERWIVRYRRHGAHMWGAEWRETSMCLTNGCIARK